MNIATTFKISSEKNKYLTSYFLKEKNVLFKESLYSIIVTRNPNWSTKILWYGIVTYTKKNILSHLKRPT
jgi:hypothetical protein